MPTEIRLRKGDATPPAPYCSYGPDQKIHDDLVGAACFSQFELQSFIDFLCNFHPSLRPRVHGSGSLLIRYKKCCGSASCLHELEVIRYTSAPLSASILILLRKRTRFVSDQFCIGSTLICYRVNRVSVSVSVFIDKYT